MKYISHSEVETKQIAKHTAKELASNIIGLSGNLGSGKTIFAKGFTEELGIKDKIISPSFVLVKQHKIPNSKGILYHIDLYRLENPKDLKKLGLEEFWSNPENIVLIEWPEKIKNLLPKNTLWITLKNLTETSRKITIE